MRLALLHLLAMLTLLGFTRAQPAQEPAAAKLLIAFSSVRQRHAPPYPRIFFYEHDGVANGKLLGLIDSPDGGVNKTRSDMHPTLSRDGRFCAFSAQFGVTDGGRIEIFDRKEKKYLEHPTLNESKDIHQMAPSLSSEGNLVAFMAWARPGASSRWGVFVFDVAAKKMLDLPKLNSELSDQRMPALSGDGKLLAYVSNARGGAGLTDIYLYDLADKKVLPLPDMNSKNLDMQPSLSGDGRLIAFTSDRSGGAGGRDIYLYDRTDKKFLPLPGLNTADHEHSPSLSADGRYLVFVSERLGGAGERDVYLYDRETGKLLPTPGLNSKDDDYDPCVVVLPQQK